MAANNHKRPIIDPGVCRCCASTKKCRLLNVEYEWIGQKEVYSDMFVDTFGLLLSHLDGEAESRLICATCVSRLRDASAFRRQVLACEEEMLKNAIQVHGADSELCKEIKEEFDLKDETGCLQAVVQDVRTIKRDDLAVNKDDYRIEQDDHFADNDDDSDAPLVTMKGESESKPKKVKKEKKCKMKKKIKGSKSKRERASKQEKLRVRREMLAALRMTDDEMLDEFQEIGQPKLRQKPRDSDQHSLHNSATIVENSYVCPFDTSFSDYFCVYCRETFSDCDKLRLHTQNHDPTGFKEVSVNKKLIQIDITRIDCRLCSEVITDLNTLREHLVSAHEKALYPIRDEFLTFKLTNNNLKCLECDGSFSFFHALKKHMAEHFGTCICDVCGAHYFEERMLVLHQKTHQKVEENFPCETCGKTFKSKHSRYLHEARTHKKEPAYQCPKCDEVLFSYSIRYRHMIEVHGEQRMYQCSHCDRAYDSRKSLREHNRRFHLKIFKHQCDLCDKRFYIPSRLKEHMATHTGERNFRCECCGKSYPRLRGLKVHMQSHNGERRHRCETCGAAFTQLANLKTHLKRQHSVSDDH